MADATGLPPDWDAFRRTMTDARRLAGMKKDRFAQLVGWPGAETVAAFEAGEIVPTPEVAMRMAEALRAYLIGPDSDDIVGLQLVAAEVAKAHRQTKRLLRRVTALSLMVDRLNGDDPGAGSPTRLDGLCEFSGVSDLRHDLLRIADMICETLDEEPTRFSLREIAFVEHLREVGVPLDTLFDALAAAGDDPG